MTNNQKLVAAFSLGVLLVAFLMPAEPEPESGYCHMVGLFKADEAAGIPAADRIGWPDFKGIYEDECE